MSYVYHEPDTLEEALDLLGEHGDEARVLAGGTAFSLLYKAGLLRPGHVIGLRRVAEIRGIELRPDGLWIGAHVTHREIERSSEIREKFPVIRDAFAGIATVRIRSQGTIGGNLCHADPAQDPPPPLIAAGATAHIARAGGQRRLVPLDEFFVDYFTSTVARDEILVGVTVPYPDSTTVTTYVRFLPRSAEDYPTVSVGASVSLSDDGTVRAARVALGGVGPTPLRAVAVEAALVGRSLDTASITDAALAVETEVNPLGDARGSASYKRAMSVVFVERSLHDLRRRWAGGDST